MTTADLSRGAFIRFNGDLCLVLEYEHRTPGNLRAFYQVKMRNVKTNRLVEHRFRSGEDIEFVRVETKKFQFLYKQDDQLVLMDTETYDQITVDEVLFGEGSRFLIENMEVTVAFDNDKPINGEVPNFVEMKVAYTEPGLRGDTATKTLKPATLENGVEIRVPLFVNEGDLIRIDTRTAEYLERVK